MSMVDVQPLLVYFPTWSGGHLYRDLVKDLVVEKKWFLLAVKPRGADDGEVGSKIAISDVLDAINHTMSEVNVDMTRIYGLGVSGGGIMPLCL
jgi:poly(3-hydroxybutyrate) depolymerase